MVLRYPLGVAGISYFKQSLTKLAKVSRGLVKRPVGGDQPVTTPKRSWASASSTSTVTISPAESVPGTFRR